MNKYERISSNLESVLKTILIHKDDISTDYVSISMSKVNFEQLKTKLNGSIKELKGKVKYGNSSR